MLKMKYVIGYVAVYIALRAVSFFFPPETSFHTQTIINSLFALAYLAVTVTFLIKKDERGWYMVAAEFILGGSGNYFAIFGIALRTCLLLASIFIFKIRVLTGGRAKEFVRKNKYPFILFIILLIAAVSGAVRGLTYGHAPSSIVADFIPYLFIGYYFPLVQLFQSQRFKNVVFNMLASAIIANALFILITLATYSSGLYILQNSYYHWFRDVAGGKITELPFHFYRIVLNEHLLLVPVLLWLAYAYITDITKNKLYLSLTGILLVVLSLNLTRIYLVALAMGILALFRKMYWKRWLLYLIFSFLFFFFSFSTLHLVASRGESLGWELFGFRLQSIVSPSSEPSSLSRMLLLPKIIEQIKLNPIIGNGLGDTVTVYSPVVDQVITTSQFDWGYLEIIDELGLVGLFSWIILLAYLVRSLLAEKAWLLASVLALLVIHITSPALFHVLGIVFITILLAAKDQKQYV